MKTDPTAETVFTKPLEGLGADIALLKRICAEHIDVVDSIDQEVKEKQGGDHGNQHTGGKVYNINLADDTAKGTSRSYALRRLRKDRPDLQTLWI